MTPFHEDAAFTLFHGDCRDVMRELPPGSVDAVVTDPPYDLLTTSRNGSRRINNPDTPAGRTGKGFMGKAWDGTGIAFEPATWAEAFRLLKPGGHLLAFGGTRTVHRLAVAIEDAGFEIRDTLVWGYASGFPKSLDLAKAIDKAAGSTGAWRQEDHPGRPGRRRRGQTDHVRIGQTHHDSDENPDGLRHVYEPATDEARRWSGWGTALKPAWEPIVMARKPMRGSVAANVLAHGTGALNIDGTRIATTDEVTQHGRSAAADAAQPVYRGFGPAEPGQTVGQQLGRWPANVVLTDPIFDGGYEGVVGGGQSASGIMRAGPRSEAVESGKSVYGRFGGNRADADTYGDAGGHSRFFLVPKADRADREPLVRGQLEERRPPGWSSGEQSPGTFQSQPTPARVNVHPTVKPVELMRHLVRLVTPPGGVVLDPFLGSGSTAIAAGAEGFRCVGIEADLDYCRIAVARLAGQRLGLGL